MERENFIDQIDQVSDEVLGEIMATMPWSDPYGTSSEKDVDGFEMTGSTKDFKNFRELKLEIWNKFVNNPQINSYIRDYMGRLTGSGFNMSSDNFVVAEKMEEIITDPRNALYMNMGKYAARSEIEGELYICLTVHTDGFIEIDFMDPDTLSSSGTDSSGIFYHKYKQNFPLWYEFDLNPEGLISEKTVIPSINIAHFPDLKSTIKDFDSLYVKNMKKSRTGARKYKAIGGFNRFIVEWNKGFLTSRNVSHLRTTIIWINHYENLKKWEIDHKKSSGAYLWVASINDSKALRTWLKMTDAQKEATGLSAKKQPGGTLILPPGITLECKNPRLPSISDADTDIMNMVVSGLNTPEDMVTGVTKGSTFAGVNATRGPQADRTSDQIEYFKRFLTYDFWRSIFMLSSAVSKFPKEFDKREAVDFKNKKPIFKNVKKKPYDLLNLEFPISQMSDPESTAKANLGSKHGPLTESLGLSAEKVASKMGIGGYRGERLRAATEEEIYPELKSSYEIEVGSETFGKPADPVKPAKQPIKPAPVKK
jgi:hypothetical protein